MPFNRPSLEQINERVENQIKGLLGITVILRRSFISVISRVISGVSHLWHGHLDYNSRQFLPTTMDEENLIAYGGIWGIPRNEAVAGIYSLTVLGVDNTSIPLNTVFRRSDGQEYFTRQSGVVLNGSTLIEVVANEAGLTSELSNNDIVELLNPIAGLESQATVQSAIIEPEDIESIDSYRSRVVDRIRNPISGGTASDYIQWAREVAGVTRAWVLPQNLGPGTVGVTFVQDNQTNIVPSAPKVEEVQEFIDNRRPVTADVTVFAPVLLPMDMTIALNPNTIEVQNNVIAEIEDLVLRDSNLSGAYKNNAELFDGKILLSRINEAISIAVGESDHRIISINGATPTDVVPPMNNLLVLGNITWQTLS